MKICFIGPANSTHIEKLCNWFLCRGHEVHVISFTYSIIPKVNVHFIDLGIDAQAADVKKIKYLLAGRRIKAIVDTINPDIVNVHYATSYGTAVALSGIKKYILSVWGSDIYDFPNKSKVHKLLLEFSLKKASKLFSTSQAMADEARKYTSKHFEITPFGVDMDLFNPNRRSRKSGDNRFIIGTVKSLSRLYGIEYILEAASIIRNKFADIDLSIRIAGDGPQYHELKQYVAKLGIEKDTYFLGKITQKQAAIEWANMDVAIIPSVSYESFGVAAVEAEASGTPLIISDIGGLKESTLPGKSSIVASVKDANDIASKLYYLYSNPKLRKKMGEEGRKYAEERYEIHKCFEHIESCYEDMI